MHRLFLRHRWSSQRVHAHPRNISRAVNLPAGAVSPPPEDIREAFPSYKITYMSLVPMVLKNLEKGLRARFGELPSYRRWLLNWIIAVNKLLTGKRPNLEVSRTLLKQVHQAFGGELRALFVGGAFTEPATLQFFYDLGIPVANAYGCTEAGTAITVNDFRPFRADTVGKPL